MYVFWAVCSIYSNDSTWSKEIACQRYCSRPNLFSVSLPPLLCFVLVQLHVTYFLAVDCHFAKQQQEKRKKQLFFSFLFFSQGERSWSAFPVINVILATWPSISQAKSIKTQILCSSEKLIDALWGTWLVKYFVGHGLTDLTDFGVMEIQRGRNDKKS